MLSAPFLSRLLPELCYDHNVGNSFLPNGTNKEPNSTQPSSHGVISDSDPMLKQNKIKNYRAANEHSLRPPNSEQTGAMDVPAPPGSPDPLSGQ